MSSSKKIKSTNGFFYNLSKEIDPRVSLGDKASSNFTDNNITILSVLIFSLLIVFLATILLAFEESSTENLRTVLLSASIFLFLNFLFLIFKATRIFNLLLFVFIFIISIITIDKTSKKNITIINSIIIFLVVYPIIVLSYFYFYKEQLERLGKKILSKK